MSREIKQNWVFAIGNYGVAEKVCTESEAEDFRSNKAQWEGSPAIKITEGDFANLSPKQIKNHWGYNMIDHFFAEKNIHLADSEEYHNGHERGSCAHCKMD